MAIPKVTPRAILLKGKERSVMKELIANGAITPGMLLSLNSSGKLIPHGVPVQSAMSWWADMYDLTGKGIDDNYAANDWVQSWLVPPGSEINALIPAAASPIVIGDLLVSNGNGMLKKIVTAASDFVVGVALQAVDNSGGGAAVRLQILTR
jgi:hypothetical protein